MKKVNVDIEVESYNNFSPQSIEQALNFYFGDQALFTVKAVEHSVHPTAFGGSVGVAFLIGLIVGVLVMRFGGG